MTFTGQQYLRRAQLLIALDSEAIDLSELHFRFAIKRGDNQTPNSAEIRIYNLDDYTAKKIQRQYTQIILNAGYETANYGLIFTGNIDQVRRGRETPTDTVVDITASDGGLAYGWAVSNGNLAAGSTLPQIFSQLVKDFQSVDGTITGPTPSDLAGLALPRGKVMFGMTRDYMRDLSDTAAATWGINDKKVGISGLTTSKIQNAVELTPATGLIGLPQQLINGFHFRALLNPNLKINTCVNVPNDLIQKYRYPLDIQSQPGTTFVPVTDANGNYRVIYAEHTGDTRGQEWYTDLICLSVDATAAPPSLFPKLPGLYAPGNNKAYG